MFDFICFIKLHEREVNYEHTVGNTIIHFFIINRKQLSSISFYEIFVQYFVRNKVRNF